MQKSEATFQKIIWNYANSVRSFFFLIKCKKMDEKISHANNPVEMRGAIPGVSAN